MIPVPGLSARRWRRLLAALVLVGLGGPGIVSCAATSTAGAAPSPGTARSSPAQPTFMPYDVSPLLHPSRKYLGVALPGVPASMAPLDAYAARTGKRPNLVEYYASWGGAFDSSGVRRIDQAGGLAYMAWEPFHVSMKSIADGSSDRYIRSFARSVGALNLPVAISFGHEMNGYWYPWGTQAVTPAEFVAAWRHIHNVFDQMGATNVIWVWSPNVINPVPGVRLKPYYPGDAYVDWVGMIGYYTVAGARTFRQLYGPTMREIQKFTKKPFVLSEVSSELTVGRAASVANLFQGVASRSQVLGFIWFDYVKRADWRIESTPAALAEFRKEAGSGLFGFNVKDP